MMGLVTIGGSPQVLEKTAEQAKERGEPAGDFFASLDKSGDGSIDMEEAQEFFKLMAQGGLLGKKDEL